MQTILLLDDEDAVRRILRLVLDGKGRRILEAATAKQGIAFASEQHLDLLIADVFLEENSGIDVARHLRELMPAVKVILSSGYPTSMWSGRHKAALAQLGSEGVRLMEKPFLLAQLRRTVDELIGPPEKPSHSSAAV